jgi:lipoprotein NlpI
MFSPRFFRTWLILLFSAASLVARAGELEPWPTWRTTLISKFLAEQLEVEAKLVKTPDSTALLARRGDLNLFLGNFPEAAADFEKISKLDPKQDAGNWRLGIAYHFTGQYEKSARQFEKYDAFDGHDRENGIWRFLAQVKTDGLEKARAEMLVYTDFDREPFPALYEMFAGKRTTDDFIAELEKKGQIDDQKVGFFGNYYAGLNEDLLGHRAHAIRLLRKAVDLMPARETVYMWNVCRLQWEILLREEAAAH